MTETAKGTIICRTKGFYYLRSADGEVVEAKIKRSLYKDKTSLPDPIIGDEVSYLRVEQGALTLITEVDSRRSVLKRVKTGSNREIMMAANIDYALIVLPLAMPEFDFCQALKIIAACYQGNVSPTVALAKADLVDDATCQKQKAFFESIDIETFVTSALTGAGVQQLKSFLKNSHTSLCGVSGSGKSSLINALFPDMGLKTGEVNEKYEYGRHTTTMARLFEPEEGWRISDNPGFRNFNLVIGGKSELKDCFPVVKEYSGQCSMSNCLHNSESGCAVKDALDEGKIDERLYSCYILTLSQL